MYPENSRSTHIETTCVFLANHRDWVKYGTFTSQFNVSIVPWASGKFLVWDVTYSDTIAASNISVAFTKVGAVAEKAE